MPDEAVEQVVPGPREGMETEGPKVELCPCGETGALLCYHFQGDRKIWHYECRYPGCWIGPKADTPKKARRLWNARG